jgi:hypothetical protein
MNVDFTDLELLAQSIDADFAPPQSFSEIEFTYVDAPIHELFDLLEGAVESYSLVCDQLADTLRQTAEQEIEFFMSLLQERLNVLLGSVGQASLPTHLQTYGQTT